MTITMKIINRIALLNPHNEPDVSVSSIMGTSLVRGGTEGSPLTGCAIGAEVLMIHYSTLLIFFHFFNMVLSSTEYQILHQERLYRIM
jgi:hypothetical protein